MDAPLNRHGSEKFDQLFEQNTAEAGSLSEIVDKHAGDAMFLVDSDSRRSKGADGGIADFISEMNPSDPEDDWESIDDDSISSDAIGYVDITGTAQGVARGFGSHLPLDLGRDGFQIKSLPEGQSFAPHNPAVDGEELDDYDDKPGT